MARPELSPIEKQAAIAFLGQRLFILVHVGALLMLVSSFHPLFLAHQVPGAVILTLAAVYDMWRSANKQQRRMLLWTMFFVNLWVAVNYYGKIFTPPIISPEEAYRVGLTYTLGMTGFFTILIGNTQGLISLRMMD